MICPWCKKEFSPVRHTQRYCSPACQKARQLANHAARIKVKRRAASAARAIEKTCPVCGMKFRTTYGHKRYCSDKCCKISGHKAERARISAKRLAARKDRTCPVCGRVFTPKKSDGVYCSRACYARSKSKNTITFVQQKDPRLGRDSLAKVRAYLALPARQRWRRIGDLTPAEQNLARRMWSEAHSGFAKYND
ncbi:MAG: hypothetical protein J6V72_10065 [Kiritimatiellae bacterium]|nr:hypothetical protein [Kiritimatiellia bacterium]